MRPGYGTSRTWALHGLAMASDTTAPKKRRGAARRGITIPRRVVDAIANPAFTMLPLGALSALGFQPVGWFFLTWFALAGLMVAVYHAARARSAFWFAWLWGVGHFAVGNNWIATAFTYQSAMPPILGWVAVVGLAFYLALFPAAGAAAAWWAAQRLERLVPPSAVKPQGSKRAARAKHRWYGGIVRDLAQHGWFEPASAAGRLCSFILLFAAAWIVTEWLRSWVFTGFAWNPLAAIGAGFAPAARLVGTYGQSGIIILMLGAVMLLAIARMRQAMALFALVAIVSFAEQPTPPTGAAATTNPTVVTIVQPNNPQGDKYDPAQQMANYRRLAINSMNRPNMPHPPRLLLWPEAAIPDYLEDGYPIDLYARAPGDMRRQLGQLLGPRDLLLTGAVALEFAPRTERLAGARNSVMIVDAAGRLGPRYDKAHLVPGGEYLPLRTLLEPLGLSRLVPGDVDFLPGPGARTLDLRDQGFNRVGVQICYEVIFSGQVVDRANRPDFIFNPSNDAWFGSWGSPQFMAQARLRAVEEGLPVVRATPTGISGLIDANGWVMRALPMHASGRIDAVIPPAHAPTLFARYGNILPLGLALLLVVAAALFALVRRRAAR